MKALSVSCPKCHHRLVLENLRVRAPHPGRELMTCGDVLVEPAARLHLQHLHGRNVLILGRVAARVTARLTLEIGRNGCVEGDVEAARVVIHDGAVLRGNCRIVRPPAAPPAPRPVPLDPTRAPPRAP